MPNRAAEIIYSTEEKQIKKNGRKLLFEIDKRKKIRIRLFCLLAEENGQDSGVSIKLKWTVNYMHYLLIDYIFLDS